MTGKIPQKIPHRLHGRASIVQPGQENRPLAGVRALVGRAEHQARPLTLGLKALGAEVTEIPFIAIRAPRSYAFLDTALKRIREYDWLVVTSVNGVRALAARLAHLGISARRLRHLEVAAIGPATRGALEKLGIEVAIVPENYVAESVIASLRGRVKGKRMLLPRARVARDTLPNELRSMGAQVDVVEAYRTIVPLASERRLQALMGDPRSRPHLVTFTSSSSARNFATLLRGRENAPAVLRSQPGEPLSGIRLASIGPITSRTLVELGLKVDIEARDYTIPGLIQAIRADWAGRSRSAPE